MKSALGHLALAMAFACLLGGYAGIVRNPLPAGLAGEATCAGMKDIRAWGGETSLVFQADLVESIRQARASVAWGAAGADPPWSVTSSAKAAGDPP
jgi:hypothetical protein